MHARESGSCRNRWRRWRPHARAAAVQHSRGRSSAQPKAAPWTHRPRALTSAFRSISARTFGESGFWPHRRARDRRLVPAVPATIRRQHGPGDTAVFVLRSHPVPHRKVSRQRLYGPVIARAGRRIPARRSTYFSLRQQIFPVFCFDDSIATAERTGTNRCRQRMRRRGGRSSRTIRPSRSA